jgi:hypothetical protein
MCVLVYLFNLQVMRSEELFGMDIITETYEAAHVGGSVGWFLTCDASKSHSSQPEIYKSLCERKKCRSTPRSVGRLLRRASKYHYRFRADCTCSDAKFPIYT